MSDSYNNFSYVYDKFMDNIPYHEWCNYLIHLMSKYSLTSGELVELGCGTATLSLLMEQNGFNITGIDNSSNMLSIASDKLPYNSNITLLLQDMCDITLEKLYDGFYCICDGLNYLLSREEILYTFQGVKHHLKTNGLFIFDLKTLYFYQNILGDQTFCDHQEDCSYTWENNFFEDDNINQYNLTIFVKENNSELYTKYNEIHHQRAYILEEIIDLLTLAGLEYVTVYDAFTENAPRDDSERIYIIARNGE